MLRYDTLKHFVLITGFITFFCLIFKTSTSLLLFAVQPPICSKRPTAEDLVPEEQRGTAFGVMKSMCAVLSLGWSLKLSDVWMLRGVSPGLWLFFWLLLKAGAFLGDWFENV